MFAVFRRIKLHIKGYSHVHDIDCHETFSATARVTSIRMLMQLAAQYDLTVHQMDAKTAYLNAYS